MSIKTRLAVLLGGLLLVFLGAWLLLNRIEQKETRSALRDARENRRQMLNHWIDVSSRSLPQFAADYIQTESLQKLTTEELTSAGREKIKADLAAAGVQALWMLRADGSMRLHVSVAGSGLMEEVPLSAQEFHEVSSETPQPRFFVDQGAVLLEVCIRRIPTADPAQREWLLIARPWDEAHLRLLSNLTEGIATLVAPAEFAEPPFGDDRVVVMRTLADAHGRPLHVLRVEYRESAVENLGRTESRQAQVFVLFGLLLIGALAIAVHTWVVRPLDLIGKSLASGDPRPMGPLHRNNDEFGRIARLANASFAQHKALQKSEDELRRTFDEKARLARDLHDGIIQSLYAAGMGLGGARKLLLPEQVELARQLEQTRGILNETIHDVRNFISGLEPEALKQQTFAHAVKALLATMQAIRPLRTTINIDDTVAAALTLAQRVHALQIAREAVSNALRHGQASHVSVNLRALPTTVEFEIVDNGQGFDLSAEPSSGRGLHNLAQRARTLGGELILNSSPGEGTSIKLIFPQRPLS